MFDKNCKEIEKELNGKIIDILGYIVDLILLLIDEGVLFCGDFVMNGFLSIYKIIIFVESKLEFI